MHATKRITVKEKTWKELASLKEAGQTYDEVLQELIEESKIKKRYGKNIAKREVREA